MPLTQDVPAMLDAIDRRFSFSHAAEEQARSLDGARLALNKPKVCGGVPDAG